MRRFLLKLLPGLCLALLAGTALAGGVVVSLAGEAPNPQAGEPFDVRFNIYSAHDGSPQDEFHPIVTATNAATGEKVTARAQPLDEVGQYSASLTLPTAGTWQWAILPEADYPPNLVSPLTPLQVAAPGTLAPAASAAQAATPSFIGVPVMLWALLGVLSAVALVAVITSRRLPAVRA